jgi:DNA polymerase
VNKPFQTWKKTWTKCEKCEIGKEAFKHVLFSGYLGAKFLFVGEAPGQAEDVRGLPFVGPVGDLFRQVLANAGYRRHEVLIVNCLVCRPTEHKPNGSVVNRAPSHKELNNCEPHVRELTRLMPNLRAVGLVGAVAQAVFTEWMNLTLIRAELVPFVHPGALVRWGIRAKMELGGEQQDRYLAYVQGFKRFRKRGLKR